jgi:putative ABC transport system permease protein
MRDFVTPDPTREMWYILMGTMLLVLLVACVNVATLQLARLTQRVHEMGVRSAMGAGAARLTRQLLTESVLLSAAGALLGLLIATWAADAFNGLLPAELGKYVNWDTRLDPRTLLFTAAVALAAGIAAGVAPALHFSRPDVNNLLREGGRGTSGSGSRQRLTGLLVIAQVATTAVLLVGSALCVQSFNKMGSDPDGIGPSSLAVLRMNLNEATYALPQQKRAFAEELARKARTLPGVAQAAVMNIAPHTWQSLASPFEIEGVAVASSAAQPFSLVESVGPEYFRTLRISLRNGRGISAADGPEAPRVAVVSQGLVRRYFPDGNALGKRIRLKIGGEWLTVVDLAADFHQHGYDKLPRPVVYVPYAQMPTEPLDLAIRVSGTDAAAVIPAAQALIRSMDPQQPVYEARTLSEIIEVWELFGMRLAANMMGALGLLALVLATVGLYGVLSYAARQRTREIGVRIALGAPLRSVRLSVVRRGLVLAGTGLAIGLTLSFAATRAIASLLYGIRGTDPATFGGAAVALLGIALAASYLPAWRAGRVDPVETLRHE